MPHPIMLDLVDEPTLPPEHARTKSMLPELLATRRRIRGRREPMLPHRGPVDAEQRAGAGKTGTLRAAIFGVNDGLVSNLALIMGVTGAGVANDVIVLAGVAGLMAGAFSMGGGEYISMRVQREVFEPSKGSKLHLSAPVAASSANTLSFGELA